MSQLCYYRVLGVSNTATGDEIRAAYKKKALQLHPDKNAHRLEEATQEFAYLQQCYSVLIDPHERRWYDQHRDQILTPCKAQEPEFLDVDDLMPYFSASTAYKGFSDGPNGFFTVYRNLFQQMEYYENQLLRKNPKMAEKIIATSFGSSSTPFMPSLKLFYDKWTHFVTLRSFSNYQAHKFGVYENRDNRRYAERNENKEREQRKKEFVATVRSLAQFIKKRDPRYQQWIQQCKEEKEDIARNVKQLKKKPVFQKKAYWQTCEEKEAYEAYFSMYDRGKEDEVISEEDLGIDPASTDGTGKQTFHCVACNKTFKSESQWENHENSKKHQKNLFQLKKKILKDEKMWKTYMNNQHRTENCNSEFSGEDDDGIITASDNSGEEDTTDIEPLTHITETEEVSETKLNELETHIRDYHLEDGAIEDNIMEFLEGLSFSSSEIGDREKRSDLNFKQKEKRKKKKEKNTGNSFTCNNCKSKFPSRNSLFAHLKSTGHQQGK